jgi:23S rRNA U2552 (ribose-2'-O)-methylase RlmE/FtsJ
MNLWSEFLTNEQRLIHKWKHYFPIYESHFKRFINRDLVLLEIGCGQGGSLQLWKRYFGPHARIIGIDINPECSAFAEDQINIRIDDQKDKTFIAKTVQEFGPPDIVIDDGSHFMSHIKASFDELYTPNFLLEALLLLMTMAFPVARELLMISERGTRLLDP